MNVKNLVLVSGACVFKEVKGESRWFMVKSQDGMWEIPKILVRKGESSVRAALRLMGEKGGMSTRVLEEAARAGGTTTVGGKVLPERFIYYLMLTKPQPAESIGFSEFLWVDYTSARSKLTSKRERGVLKLAKEELKKWKKLHPNTRS